MILEQSRLRLKVEAGVFYGIVDALTGEMPRAWRGADLRIEVGLFYRAALLEITNLESLTVEIFHKTRVGLPFISAEVAGGDLNTTLTLEEWNAGTHEHAHVEVSAEDTNIVIHGIEELFWLVVTGQTLDEKQVTFGAGPILFVEDGHGNGLPGPVITFPMSDIWRFREGAWEAYFAEDESWRPLLPVMVDGHPTFGFGDPV